ncbi:MAG: hypothetical protein ACHQD7_11600, partial [Chitinophagales bacterium]
GHDCETTKERKEFYIIIKREIPMLVYAKKVYDSILSELANLNSDYQTESFSQDQRLAFVANSIQQLQTYCIQLMTVIECLDNNR